MSQRIIKVYVNDFPPLASDAVIAGYVFDELRSGGGCRDKNDPMFGSLDVEWVEVRGVKYVDPDKS